MELSISDWKYGKNWVYSITYDEALSDLARFVIPTHLDVGIPGHVEVVAGQIGQVRNCGASSFNGYRHMGADELRQLLSMGWGVGCHSWSHEIVMDDPERELLRAREAIEEATGRPVTVYCAPGTNDNLTPPVLERLPGYGYLAGMSITDDVNRPDDDLLWINRIPIHERYWGVFDSAFDAHKRIRQAKDQHGWIVDYCHCPLEQAIHDYKDCTAAHHRERLEAVASEGGRDCWFANPDDVVDYRYVRRHTRIEADSEGRFTIRLEGLPERVQHRELTFELRTHLTAEALDVRADGNEVALTPARAGVCHFTVPVRDGLTITCGTKEQDRVA